MRSLTLTLACAGTCLLLSCSRQMPPGGAGPQATGEPAQRMAAAAASAPIVGILEDWASGRPDQAVAGALKLYDSNADDASWRPCQLSEQEFVKLPADEREVLKQRILDSLEHMRRFARELRRRAVEADRAGQQAEAQRLMGALRRLAQANRGPQVPLSVDMVAKAIEEGLVNRPLREEPQTMPAASQP